MINITSLQDMLALKEDYDIEFKNALGRDGKGKLPDDFFETYSAMANSYGGNERDILYPITGLCK